MSGDNRHDATPPPRGVTPSMVDVIEAAVAEAIEPKFKSLMPIQEEQTQMLRESAAERAKRAASERAGRWGRRLRLLAMVIIAVCEAYQTFRGH